MTEKETWTDSFGKQWTIAELNKEGFDVAYVYRDKDGRAWMRLKSHAHITPPNIKLDS